MKVHVDTNLCDGGGPCVDICPEAFELNQEGTAAVAKMDDIPDDLEQSCREAATNCPTDAIIIDE